MPEQPEPGVAAAAARLHCVLPAEPRSVGRLRHAVVAYAAEHGVSEQTRGAIALAVTEAATNAVLHAFVGREPGTVGVAAEPLRDALLVRVTDDGRGLQPRADSPGLGMGLPTMGQLTTRLDFREGPGGRGTEVRMVFSTPGSRGPADARLDDELLSVLAEVARLAERSAWPDLGLEELAGLLVPRAATACAVELLDAAGTSHRLVARGGATPPATLLRAVVADGGVQAREGWVAAPLRTGERVTGVLALVPRPEAVAEAQTFVELLAERVAGGVATTRLIDELQRSRRRFERVLGALAEAITVNDEHGRTVYVNDAAVELLGGASADELLAASSQELADRFLISREDGSPVVFEELPGQVVHAGRPTPPLLTRSVHRATGRARWLLTKTTLLDDDGLLAVNIIEDVTEAKDAELRQRLLASAGELLAALPDFTPALDRIVRLTVPVLADWAAIDLLSDDGTRLERVGLAHVDPDRVRFGRELHERFPPEPVELLADGEARLLPELTEEMLRAGVTDPEHLELLLGVGMRSVLLVPLRAGQGPIGLLTLVTAESRRTFTASDLAFAQDLASRIVVALEHARLRRELGGGAG